MHCSGVFLASTDRSRHLDSFSTVCSAVRPWWHKRKHQSSTSLALCEGNPPHWPVDSPHKYLINSERISMSWCNHVLLIHGNMSMCSQGHGWHLRWQRNYQLIINIRDQSRYLLSQWETLLHCNVSHWLGTYLDWSLKHTLTNQIQARMDRLLPLGLHSTTRPRWLVLACLIYILLHVLFKSYCIFQVLWLVVFSVLWVVD